MEISVTHFPGTPQIGTGCVNQHAGESLCRHSVGFLLLMCTVVVANDPTLPNRSGVGCPQPTDFVRKVACAAGSDKLFDGVVCENSKQSRPRGGSKSIKMCDSATGVGDLYVHN